ncbi:FG-GAP repeat domain-containing protein [Actinomadura fibrosa]|uniref:FG-GAP repeat domain-containing protein n=1 Tax=Actinomadura fibrosa TaxID=111802 RepID=A0ABW2Y1L0_9ACTN|nr:FG-GAP and VCBS repeat-containing protein [Actinomadura fibrosa]
MRIRVLSAAAAAVVLAFGAAAAVAVAQGGDGRSGEPHEESRRDAASHREIASTLPRGPISTAVTKPAAPGDLNGDGYPDIAAAGPNGNSGTEGFVTVIYGGPGGADPARRQVVAHPDASRAARGWQLESADFDTDGYADLLTHRTDTPTTIVYGGPRGLTSRTAVLPEATGQFVIGDFDGNGAPDVAALGKLSWADKGVYDLDTVVVYANPGAEPGKPIVSSVAKRGDYQVPRTLLVGDFTGDHCTDLLIGASNWVDGLMRDSWFELRPGTAGGLGPARVLPDARAGEIDAADAVAGDFDGDGRMDLLTSFDGDVPPEDGADLVSLPFTGRGFGKARRYHDASLGMLEHASILRVGDVNVDGRADLLVNTDISSDDRSRAEQPGAVTVLFGSRTGITAKGRRTFREDPKDALKANEPHHRFGTAFSLTDTDRNGRIELIVGAPGEHDGEGNLYIFPGTAAGPTVKGVKHIGAAAVGLGGKKIELGGHLLD